MSINTTDAAASPTSTGTYAIDSTHSRLGFVARHAMISKVRGSFNTFAGSGYFDVGDPTKSHMNLVIEAASIDTGNADRDAHLRSDDFFATEKYPQITFASTTTESTGADSYRVTGDLTIKGVTKATVVDFDLVGSAVDPYHNHRLGLEGRAVVNRKDWGLVWNTVLEAGGVLVSDKITLELDVSAIRTDAAM